MLINYATQVILLVMLLESQTEAAAIKICGRQLSEMLSSLCKEYNSPPWDNPMVVEQPATIVRKKRQLGIADQCCQFGCTRPYLKQYCSIITNSDSSQTDLETHMIADRSAEETASAVPVAPADFGQIEVRRDAGDRKRLELIKNAPRAAPVVGTVSPLLTWGRTLNTDLPLAGHDRYAYVVYA